MTGLNENMRNRKETSGLRGYEGCNISTVTCQRYEVGFLSLLVFTDYVGDVLQIFQ